MTNFNEKIYEYRKANNFTQEEIAQELGVSRQTISNWETGTAQPTIDKAIELARLYGVSIDELVGNTGTSPKRSSKLLSTLVNKVVTLHLSYTSEIFLSSGNSEIKNCEIIEVTPSSLRIITESKKKKLEQLIFLKDVIGFELEVN